MEPIRKIVPEHYYTILKIWIDISIAERDTDPESWTERLSVFLNKELKIHGGYVYVRLGQVVGFVIVDNNGYIYELYVEKHFQRKGIGTTLLRYLNEKYSFLHLQVYKDNLGAIKFYQDNGFQRDSGKETKEKYYMIRKTSRI